jgi:MFS family permease
LFQIPITRRIDKRPPMLMMAVGVLFFAVGLGMFGQVSAFWMFAVGMAILTIGEMLVSPTAAALVASFSPESMRGRYNFIYGSSWGISLALGPFLAGKIMDNYNPDLLWTACFVIGVLDAAIFLLLYRRTRSNAVAVIQAG